MQHIPTVSGASEQPQRDWLPTVAYVLLVALLLIFVGMLLWPSVTAEPPRDAAYVNPELRLAEQFRSRQLVAPAISGQTGPLYTKELALQQRQLALGAQPQHLVDPYWTHFHDYMIAPEVAASSMLALNPELKYTGAQGFQPVQDFAHANPEVGLFQRLQEFER